MNLADVHAVIDSAKSRGRGSLDRFIQRRLPEASPGEVSEAADVALEIIESVPVFLASAYQAAEERGLEPVVAPILERAAGYFLNPVDVIPEMTHGLGGLLDDAYVVLKLLDHLDQGPTPLLDWNLAEPIAFLGGLVGKDVTMQLDLVTVRYLESVEAYLTRYWSSGPAEA